MKRFFFSTLTALKYAQAIKGGHAGILQSIVGSIWSLAGGQAALIRVPTVFITRTGEFVGNAVEIQDLLNNEDAMACIGQMMGGVKLQEKKENIASELKGRAMDIGIGGATRKFVPNALATKHDRSILKSGNSWYFCTRCKAAEFQRPSITPKKLACPKCQGRSNWIQKMD